MSFPKTLKELCMPAYIYFIISSIVLLIMLIQNIGNSGKYSLGNYYCSVPSLILIFIVKIIYILFWTYILNLICRDGYSNLSWLLVLLPFILLFILIGMMMLNQGLYLENNKETFIL